MLGSVKLKVEEEKKKKAWTTPTLTPIVRRKPKEGIMVGCKASLWGDGPSVDWRGCDRAKECAPCGDFVAT